MNAKRLGAWLCAMALVVAQGSQAATHFYQLQGVAFDDGTAATGAFVYDDVANAVVAWNIEVRGNDTLLPFAYMPGDSVAGFDFAPPTPMLVFSSVEAGNPYPGGVSERQLRITPTIPLGGAATQIFVAGNKLDFSRLRGPDDWDWIEHAEPANKLAEALTTAPVTTDSAEQARDRVLANGGATLPRRDAIDLRIVGDVQSGGGKVINSPKDVGGLPHFASSPAPVDADSDGLPDAWEAEHGLDSSDAADQALDADGDGYTNLEERLNGTNPRRAEASPAP